MASHCAPNARWRSCAHQNPVAALYRQVNKPVERGCQSERYPQAKGVPKSARLQSQVGADAGPGVFKVQVRRARIREMDASRPELPCEPPRYRQPARHVEFGEQGSAIGQDTLYILLTAGRLSQLSQLGQRLFDCLV
jgi:hypothetical protein